MGAKRTNSRTWRGLGGREGVEEEAVEVVGRLLGDPVADAFEDLEAVRAVDVLARGLGALASEGDVVGAPDEHRGHADRTDVADETRLHRPIPVEGGRQRAGLAEDA